MKRLAVLSLLLIFVLAGCQSLSIGDKTAQARESGLHVILYYDKNDSRQPESVYFNALLNEINHSKLERQQITIRSGKAASLKSRYKKINDYPAIIVKYNGMEKTRVEGNKDLNFILKKLNHAIQSKS